MTWKAWIAAPDLSDRHELGDELISFKGIARYLNGGEWQAEVVPDVWAVVAGWMPLTPDMAPPLFAVVDGSRVVMSGPLRTAQLGRQGPDRTLTLNGVDEYEAALGSRLVWPQPSTSPPAWVAPTFHTVTGQASGAIVELIRRHRGNLARTERQGTPLDVTDQGAGISSTWQFRLPSLTAAVSQIAQQAGLAVAVERRLADNVIAVIVGAVRNRTTLVLDESMLGDSTLTLAAATATTVVAGGAGAGASRTFAIAGGNVAGDARTEMFSDQRSATSSSLQASADATRAADAATASFTGTITPEAADRYVWRTHYDLGDTMTLRIGGTLWPVTVEAVNLSSDTSGQRAVPVLGATPRHALEQLLRDVDGLADRLNNIEVA